MVPGPTTPGVRGKAKRRLRTRPGGDTLYTRDKYEAETEDAKTLGPAIVATPGTPDGETRRRVMNAPRIPCVPKVLTFYIIVTISHIAVMAMDHGRFVPYMDTNSRDPGTNQLTGATNQCHIDCIGQNKPAQRLHKNGPPSSR